MKAFIFIILLLVFLFIFAFLYFFTMVVYKIRGKKKGKINIPKLAKWVIGGISISLSCFVIYLWIFSQRTSNYREANIKNLADGYSITVFGKSNSITHDPISFLERNTYEDSIQFSIPSYRDTMEANEILARGTYFKFVKGNIILNRKEVKINLYYIDAYDKKIKALRWNGEYKLNWK